MSFPNENSDIAQIERAMLPALVKDYVGYDRVDKELGNCGVESNLGKSSAGPFIRFRRSLRYLNSLYRDEMDKRFRRHGIPHWP